MTLRKERVLEIDTGSTRSHSVESSLWKRLWTRRKTDYEMNKFSNSTTIYYFERDAFIPVSN
jgi:hypothetical protein